MQAYNITRLFIVALFVANITSCLTVLDKEDYNKAIKSNSINDYDEYLKKYPHSVYSHEIKHKRNHLLLEEKRKMKSEAIKKNTLDQYELYIKTYPNPDFSEDEVAKIDELRWYKALEEDTEEGYLNYINNQTFDKFRKGYYFAALREIENAKLVNLQKYLAREIAVNNVKKIHLYIVVEPYPQYAERPCSIDKPILGPIKPYFCKKYFSLGDKIETMFNVEVSEAKLFYDEKFNVQSIRGPGVKSHIPTIEKDVSRMFYNVNTDEAIILIYIYGRTFSHSYIAVGKKCTSLSLNCHIFYLGTSRNIYCGKYSANYKYSRIGVGGLGDYIPGCTSKAIDELYLEIIDLFQ